MAMIGSRTRIRAAVDMTCALCSLTEEKLLGFDSNRFVSHARKLACWAAHRILLVSQPQIAEHFGDRDHTTIIYLIRDIDRLLISDDPTVRQVRTLRKEIDEWSRMRRRDPTCQTDAACARLRQLHSALAPKPNGRRLLSDQAWYDRDGSWTTPVNTFKRQNQAFAAAMEAELERMEKEGTSDK